MRREDFVYIMIAFVLLAFCAFGNLNTRIGWPGLVFSQEGWAAIGHATMYGSLGAALVMMIRSARTGRPCQLSLVLMLLVVAAGILQWLPRSVNGLQFLPVSPWSFNDWAPFLISIVSWFFLGLVTLALICWDRAVGFPAFMLVFLAVNALLSFWSVETSKANPKLCPVVDPLAEYRSQNAEWSTTRDEAHRVLGRLRCDREALVNQLQRLGVRSSADLTNIPAARPLAEELAEVVHQIEKQEEEVEQLDAAVVEAESHLRRIERQGAIEATSLRKAEVDKVLRMGLELGESQQGNQGDLVILQADEVLDEIMAESKVSER